MSYNKLLKASLEEFFAQNKNNNSKYSMRKMAKFLAIGSGALSEIISGKRKISKELAIKIYNKIENDPDKILNFKNICFENILARQSGKLHFDSEINEDQYQLISEWFHFGILSLMKTKNFKSDKTWIANRLGISITTTSKAIERLEKIKLIKINSNGEYVRTYEKIKTSDNVTSQALQKAHLTDLELAKKALLSIDVSKRDFSSTTMAIDINKIEKAKEIIRKFQDDISDLLEDGKNANEVYQLCVQLFPLTKLSS